MLERGRKRGGDGWRKIGEKRVRVSGKKTV